MDVVLDGNALTFAQVAAVAAGGPAVRLADAARDDMAASHAWVLAAANGSLRDADGHELPVYGVNTGFGSLARVRIPASQASQLSWNLMRSHAAGVGPDVPAPVVRAMMLLRANALAKGASGCQPALVDTLCAMLNAGVLPCVPQRGSCGSSGDLAPLSHLGLVVFRAPDGGETGGGEAIFAGERLSGTEAMRRAGIPQLVPGPKEGLAMTNGAQLTTAYGALAVVQAEQLVQDAEIACALSFEALRGVSRALHPGVHALRPYAGAIACAANLRSLLAGSTLVDSLPDKVQDAYSLRCAPQIFGGIRDGLSFARQQVQVELNAATDNPLILLDDASDNKAFSAGMFHGEPVGLALDHLRLCLVELAAIAERRTYRLTTGTLSGRLPPLLAERVELGLMMPQVAAATLVSRCRQLAYPASADSIPTCEDQEDHVAMSTTAARRTWEVLAMARQVVAIEVLAACKGLWWRQRHDPGALPGVGTAAALAAVERLLGRTDLAAAPAEDMARVDAALAEGLLRGAVCAALSPEELV